MAKFYQLSKPSLDQSEVEAISLVLDNGYLGMGEIVTEFESLLSKYFRRNVVAVSSCTAAIFLALEAAGVKAGDEVLVQSLTYTATYQAIIATGAIPVSCDVYIENLSIDLEDAQNKITSRTKAIIPVHYNGYADTLPAIIKFGIKNGIRVVEDAAHAFGCKVAGNLVGSFGDITCLSFDPVKSLTCGEGGAVISNDLKIIERIRKTRFIGLENNNKNKPSDGIFKYESALTPGWRYHMNNINASIGISQFNKFSMIKEKRQVLAKHYDKNFVKNPFVELLPYNYNDLVPYVYVIKLKNNNNLKIIEKMSRFGIQSGYHYFPCHLQDYFKKFSRGPLLVTENLYERLLSLPMHCGLDFDDVDFISQKLLEILGE